ncbi:MAG: hypothetical protein ACYDEX_26060 [Mobilitalea sp.]
MVGFFVMLLFLSIIVLVVGLIKPELVIRWGTVKTRGRVLLIFGLAAIACFIMIGVTAPPLTPEEKQARLEQQQKKDAEKKAIEEQDAKAKAEQIAKEEVDRKVVEEQRAKEEADRKAKDEQQAKLDARNYKDSAKQLNYRELARNPDNYKGVTAVFTGKVVQVMESGNNVTLRVNVTKSSYGWDDTIFVNYRKLTGESRILEDDIIKLWGTIMGLKTYAAVMGNQIIIPEVDAKFIDVL